MKKLKIALDFDDTYTAHTLLWDAFLQMCEQAGHEVYCVTARYDNEFEAPLVESHLSGKVKEIFYTGRKAKIDFMEHRGVYIDIWIDDNPFSALYDLT